MSKNSTVGPLSTASHRDFRKPKFNMVDRVRMSKYASPFRKGVQTKFTPNFLKLLQFLPENLQNTEETIKDEQDETILGNFYQKYVNQNHIAVDLFKMKTVTNACAQLFPEKNSALLQKCLGAN